MRIIDNAPPAVALAELKAFLRIESADEDALLAGLLRAATETVEAMLGVLLIEREVEERGALAGGRLRLTAEPARTLVEVLRLDGEGEAAPLAERELERQCFLTAFEPDLGQQTVGGIGRGAGGQPDIGAGVAPGQQGRLLEHHRRPLRPPERAIELGIKAGEDAQQRGLADAGGAGQRDDLALADREAQSAEHPRRAEELGAQREVEDRRAHRSVTRGGHGRRHAVTQRSHGWKISASISSITAMKLSA